MASLAIQPIITFKAGVCDADFSSTPPRIKPNTRPGYLYLYNEDDLYHFCWRPRAASLADPEIDLVMVPTDATFVPYLGPAKDPKKSPVNGRVFVLKFSSSSQRHFFWLQSREQPPGKPGQFSQRDLRLGQIVDDLLQGNEIDTHAEIENLRNARNEGADNDDDGDAEMEDAPPSYQEDLYSGSGGGGGDAGGAAAGGAGAGAGATGGDVREEGGEARDGGQDGGRAQVNDAVQAFLRSLQGPGGAAAGAQQRQQQSGRPFTTLAELLPASLTTSMIEAASPEYVEELLVQHLPAPLTYLEHGVDEVPEGEADPEVLRASVQALGAQQQRDIVRRVLRSPQFSQGLMSLTAAIRDGGLPSISEALAIPVAEGGYTGPDRRTPLSGGDAVQAFMEGVRRAAEKKE